jgi:ATP-dependent protease Clp ATPase subunit
MTDTCYCSFCGLSQDQVEILLAGPAAAFICPDCVELAVKAIAHTRAEKQLVRDAMRCAFCQPTPVQFVASA